MELVGKGILSGFPKEMFITTGPKVDEKSLKSFIPYYAFNIKRLRYTYEKLGWGGGVPGWIKKIWCSK